MELTDETKKQKLLAAKPMWQIVLTQFLEHRLATVGLGIIAFFLLVSLSAPLISKLSGLSPDEQNVFNRYATVFSRLDTASIQREMAVERFIAGLDQERVSTLSRFLLDQNLLPFESTQEDILFDLAGNITPKELTSLLRELRTGHPEVLGLRSFENLSQSFTRLHVLGTDQLGRDVLIRLIFGTRVSITVGILVAFAAATIGLLIGSLAGYYGGLLDAFLMRVTDALISLPILVVMIVVSAIDLTELLRGGPLSFVIGSDQESIVKMILILCLFSWMQVARLVRGSILSLKEQEFILAAKTLGAKDRWIILSHVVPNVIAPLLVAVTLGIGNSILFEAALSFLGLGIQPPTPSWGNMLFNAQEMVQHAPLLAILPGLLILLTVISFNFVGDGLQDAIDPKAIRR